jgi:hypothetical protein
MHDYHADCCPACKAKAVVASRFRWYDVVSYLAGLGIGELRPFRCTDCGNRFWAQKDCFPASLAARPTQTMRVITAGEVESFDMSLEKPAETAVHT